MPRLARHLWAFATVVVLLAAIGCSPAVRMPNLLHPGTAQQQRAEALIHDPYPLDDVAPAIVGGRPLAYQRPVPEVERARNFYSRLPSAGRAPVYTPAPIIQTPAPYVPALPAQPAPYGYSPAPSPQPVATPPPFRY
jgi:hypothetical protein